MKYFFNAKILKLYCIFYTLITIAVNIYCLIIGHDYTGLWHNIDRAIVLYLVMLLIVLIIHFRFKNKLINSLIHFLPLFISLLLYGYLLFIRGIIAKDLLLKIALAFLILYVGLALIGSLWKAIKNTSKSIINSNSRKNLSFSPSGLLMIILIILPIILWIIIKGKDNLLFDLINNNLYLIAGILFLIISLGLLLSTNKNEKFDFSVLIFIVIYYICFLLCFLDVINVFIIQIGQVAACIALIIYEIRNKAYFSLSFIIAFAIIIFIACINYFGE